MSLMNLWNPGFETGVHADARSIISTAVQTSVTVEAGAAHTGSWGAKWNPSSPSNMDLTMTPKVTGQTTNFIPSGRGRHTFSVWLRTNVGAQGAHSVTLTLRCYDKDENLLDTKVYTPSATIPVTTSWQEFAVTSEPVSRTAYIQPTLEINLVSDLNNASFNIDDMSLDRELIPAPSGSNGANFNETLRLEIQNARNDAFVWGVSTWTGYRWGGPSDTATSGVEWMNILGPSHEIKINRGLKRDGLTLALEAGILEATVYDSEVDPNTNPYIKPGTPMRLVYDSSFGDIPVYTGVLRQVRVSYRGTKPTVYLSAIDRVKDLANINRSGVVAGNLPERAETLLGKHGISYTVDGGEDVDLAQNAYDSTLLNHLSLATNTARGAVFVDKTNDVIVLGQDSTVGTTPQVFFTDQRKPAGDSVTNLIKNPSFEDGLAGWTTSGTGTLNSINDGVRTGLSSGAVSRSDVGYGLSGFITTAYIPVTAGTAYSASAYFYLVSGTTLNGEVRIDWYDASDVLLSNVKVQPTLTVGDEWKRGWFTATAPAGAVKAKVRAWISGSTFVGYVDDVMFYEGSTEVPYFDGDSPGAYWNEDGISTYDPSRFVEYTDISVAYDSTNLANDIYVNNKTYGLSEEMEPVSVETKYGPFRNVTSIATYGAFSEEIDTTFANELDLQAFAQEILSETSRPELRVDRVRFNASNLIGTAANLEIFDLVKVEYTNEQFHIDEAFHVLAIEHTITAEPNTHKWLVDVDLISLGGNE